jgi:hypothetical protein
MERLAAVQLKEVAARERVRQQEAASLATKDEVQTQGPYIYLDPRRALPFSLAWLPVIESKHQLRHGRQIFIY